MMHSAHQIRQNTSKADEENMDIGESLKLETSNGQIQDIIRSGTEQLIHHRPYEEHQEHQQKGSNVTISDEELSGTGIPYIKTEMTLDTLSNNINKNEIFYDMDQKNDENGSDDAKLSGLFKPTNELSGSSDDETRNNSETFTDNKQTYDNIGNSGTFQQKNHDNRSLTKSSRDTGKTVYCEEDMSEFEEPTNDVTHLEHRFNRKELKIEIESIRQECDKIAQLDKVFVNKRKKRIKSEDPNLKIGKEMQECNVEIEKEMKESDMTKTNREIDIHSEKDGMFDSSENKSVSFSRIKNGSEVESEAEMNIASDEEDSKVPNSVQVFGQYLTSEPFTIHRRRDAGEHIPDFRCIICELEFDFMFDMNYHMALYHKMKCIRKSFSCSSCVDDIPDWFQLSIDRDQGENNPEESQDEAASATYSCKICSHTYANIEFLHKHIHSNHDFDFESIKTLCSYCKSQLSETVYEVCTLIKDRGPRRDNSEIFSDASHLCKICNVSCKDKAEVNLHRKLHLQRKGSYRCLKCDKTFKKCNLLENHVWMHYDKTPFRCRYCATYKNRSDCIYLHELNHLPERKKKFKCNQCEFRSWTKNRLTSHLKNTHSDKRYQCNMCPATYKSKSGFLHHKIKKLTGQFRFTCDICGAGAVTQQHLNIHKESHENICCPVCNKKLFRRSLLSQHMKYVHGKRERLPCDQCGKMFASTFTLAAHYTLHTGEKKFKCPQCDKYFRTPKSLGIHKLYHSGIKEHACTYCDKAFYTATNLQDHIRIHTGEKPFKCVICQKAFAKSCNLKKHKKLLNH